ncbi:MAG: SRPBCC domain-containing protein [Planctomycetaceae bacterium]|nr:SRPBCC domain-containing protein [Planctomycetaceae bacterium]
MQPALIHTPTATAVEVVRRFAGPIEAVWLPFTDAEVMRYWMMGPPGWSMPVCEMEFEEGGAYENVFRNEADGSQITITGHIREIQHHRRLVLDERHSLGVSSDAATQATTVTFTFEPTKGKTTLTTLIEYASQAARDEALSLQMGAAMEMGYCRIDEWLQKSLPSEG